MARPRPTEPDLAATTIHAQANAVLSTAALNSMAQGRVAQDKMAQARLAQHDWAALPLSARIAVLRRLRWRLAEEQDAIVAAICADTGKPPVDALSAELFVTLEQMRYYERHAKKILAQRPVGRSLIFYFRCSFNEIHEPHGVVLLYAPANYPFQLAMLPAITALFAGNAVVLKVSERTPAVAHEITRLCEAILPPGLLTVVNDGPETAAQHVIAQPDLLFFTGSTQTGRRLAQLAAERLIPAVLELGGKDAALVFADCNLKRTVEGVLYGAFANAGQVCVGIKRLYVEESIAKEFIALLCQRIQQLDTPEAGVAGFGDQDNRKQDKGDQGYGRLYAEADRLRLEEQIKDAIARGAKILAGDLDHPELPVLLTEVAPNAMVLTDETFGPLLCVATFASEAEAIRLANQSPFALSASLWTSDGKRAERVAAQLSAANCSINDVIRNIANPAASFGGNRASGYGRYHGPAGLLAMSRSKTVMVTNSRKLREIHWFPWTDKNFDGIKKMIRFRHQPWRGSGVSSSKARSTQDKIERDTLVRSAEKCSTQAEKSEG